MNDIKFNLRGAEGTNGAPPKHQDSGVMTEEELIQEAKRLTEHND